MTGDEEQTLAGNQTGAEIQYQHISSIESALIRLLDELQPGRSVNIRGCAVGVAIFFLVIEIHTKLPLSIVSKIYMMPFVFGLLSYILYIYFESKNYSRKQIELLDRIKSISLVHRMAADLNGFPVIHDYAPKFWISRLGPVPRSIVDWIHVIAYNLDWYLKPPQKLRIGRLVITANVGIALGIMVALTILLCLELQPLLFHFYDVNWNTFFQLVLPSEVVFAFVIAIFVLKAFLNENTVLWWAYPLKKLYAQTLLTAVRDYRTQLQHASLSPVSLAPPAAPPCPPG
jgi:hypothetical protein